MTSLPLSPILQVILHEIFRKVLREIVRDREKIDSECASPSLPERPGRPWTRYATSKRKGFIKSARVRLKTRQVRQYRDEDLRRVQAIIKYRRQGFTWDAALSRAEKEVQNPPLL